MFEGSQVSKVTLCATDSVAHSETSTKTGHMNYPIVLPMKCLKKQLVVHFRQPHSTSSSIGIMYKSRSIILQFTNNQKCAADSIEICLRSYFLTSTNLYFLARRRRPTTFGKRKKLLKLNFSLFLWPSLGVTSSTED